MAALNDLVAAEADLKTAVRLIRSLSRYADGHGLTGKWADELRQIKAEADEFVQTHGTR